MILALCAFAWYEFCGEEKIEGSAPFTITEFTSSDFATRRRSMAWVEVPVAMTHEAVMPTIRAAMRDALKRRDVDVAAIWLYPSGVPSGVGIVLAKADYARDGRGWSGEDSWTWDVTAVPAGTLPISADTVRIIGEWMSRRDEFRNPDGQLRDAPLRRAVAESLGMSPDDVKRALSESMRWAATERVEVVGAP